MRSTVLSIVLLAGALSACSDDTSSAGTNGDDAGTVDTGGGDSSGEVVDATAFIGVWDCDYSLDSIDREEPETEEVRFHTTEIDGGFELTSPSNVNPFFWCETEFDVSGNEASLRADQFCGQAGNVTWSEGDASVTADGFTARMVGEGDTGQLFVNWSCTAGTPIGPENGEPFLGMWTCDGESEEEIGEYLTTLEIDITLSVEEWYGGRMRFHSLGSDVPLATCVVLYEARGTTANLVANQSCDFAGLQAPINGGRTALEDGHLFGSVGIAGERAQQTVRWDCVRP